MASWRSIDPSEGQFATRLPESAGTKGQFATWPLRWQGRATGSRLLDLSEVEPRSIDPCTASSPLGTQNRLRRQERGNNSPPGHCGGMPGSLTGDPVQNPRLHPYGRACKGPSTGHSAGVKAPPRPTRLSAEGEERGKANTLSWPTCGAPNSMCGY